VITLKMTCGACPEQYDALDEEGNLVGYLRLRWGSFRVEVPDCGGETIYQASPEGDGRFMDHERDYYLRFAVKAIEQWRRGEFMGMPPAPDVEYKLEGFESSFWD
jgi:hypothetical protein